MNKQMIDCHTCGARVDIKESECIAPGMRECRRCIKKYNEGLPRTAEYLAAMATFKTDEDGVTRSLRRHEVPCPSCGVPYGYNHECRACEFYPI